MMWENLIPASLGNLLAGVVIMSVGFSYFFGRLKSYPCFHRNEELTLDSDFVPEEPAPEASAASPPPLPPALAPEPTLKPDWAQTDAGFARTQSC